MINKKELLEELSETFEKTKKELGFKASYEDIEECCFISDGVLEAGYISPKFERQLSLRMVSTFYSWISELHGWVMPPIGNLITNNEAKKFTDEDKKTARELMMKAMYFLRKDKINGLNRDKKAMGELIDEMIKEKKVFLDRLKVLIEKSKAQWEEDLKEKKEE